MSEHRSIQALAILAALFFFVAGVEAAVAFPGILDATYPSWNRISDRSDGLGGFTDSANDTLPYEVLEIKTTAPGDTLTATVNAGTQFDSFLALYSSFNPAFPLSNILAADDDSGGYPQAQLAKAGLAANTSYFLVVSSYSSAANSVYPLYGSYGLTLGGSFSVVQKGTATVVSASSNPVIHGQPLTLTATVTKSSGIALPTGTITFKDGGTTLGTGTLNAGSQASLTISTLAAGTHSITALYGGEARYAASTSAPLSVTVAQPPAITTNPATAVVATGATLNATVNANFASTQVTFEYGTSAAYGSSIVAAQSPVAGTTTTSVTAALSGLAPGTPYHFRVKGVNAVGTTYGDDQSFVTQQAWQLNVSLFGTGSGTVTSDTNHPGIGCPSMCQELYAEGTVVTLSQYPSAISTFGGWSGACTAEPCVVTMDGAKTVTATFVQAPLAKNATTNTDYPTLADALGAASSGNELQMLGISYDDTVSLNTALILNGGWSATYLSKSGLSTTLNGSLTVTGGDSTAETLVVKGQLVLQGGSLRVNDVIVRP